MYKQFHCELKFRDKIYGGLPKNEADLESYVKSAFKSDDTSPTDTDLDLTEELEKRTTGFRKDNVGIYIGSYQIKAMLAESASLLGITVKKRGSKQTLKEGLIVQGLDAEDNITNEKVYFLPTTTEPHGTYTHAGQVSTAQGSRSILKRMEYIEKATIKFRLILLENRMSDDARGKGLLVSDLKLCLAHGRELGLGSHRKYESGRFNVIKFKQLENATPEDVIDF